MHRQYQSGNKSQLTNSRNLGLHQDNTSDEFLSAIQGDDTLHLDDNQLPRNSYQNNNSQLIIPNDLQLSRIDHKNDQYQISLDDLSGVNAASGFNRKEERVKNQIVQFVLDRILYEQVIPQMIQDMARSSILNFQTLNKSNQIILTQKADEIYNDDILPKVLVQFLNEFMNVTDQSHAAEKALKKYVDENVIENVNFILCSEIWNDCLLIPHLMKEDPNICVSNMINDFTKELVIDLYNNRANFQQVEKSKQQQQLVPQSYAVKPKKEKVNSSQFSNNFEIHKYVEDNLVQNFVIEEVEDIVINIMQEIQFQSKKIPQIISQEIYDDLLQDQIRVTSQQVMKKERLLIKGADSFFQMFIQEEMGDLIIEVIESSKISPQKYSEDAVTQVQEKLIQQMFRECSVKAENQMIQKKIVHEMVDVQMDMLITSLVQVNLVQIKNDQIAQQRSIDTLISDVIFNQISDVIFDAMKNEKKLIIDSENVMEQLVQDQVVLLAQEGIDDEIAQEEYDGIIDKIIEFDIWRDTVKDLKLEEEGIFALLEDWTDAFTGEFFIDNFTEIKNEYLRGYKEQITKLENESTIIPQQQQIQNISYNIISNHSRKNDYQVQSLNTSQRVDGMNNTRFYDIASQSGHKGNQSKIASFRGASAIGRKMSSTNSNNQFLNNTSQFQSVNSDGFYDCNNENFIDAEEQEIIKDFEHRITQQEQAYGQGNYGNQAVDNSIIKLNKIQSDFDFNEELEFQMERQSDYSQTKKNIQKVQANYLKQPTFETQTDIMDETLQNLEIDEGTMKSPHHQNYYIIPQIKSLDFLNIRQMNFKNYFQSSKIISNNQQVQRANAPVMLPVDSQAIDVLCVNCYECVKFDEVDIHSIECLKNQELLMNSKIQSPDKNSIYDYYMHKQSSGVKEVSDFPIELQAYLNQDDMMRVDLERSYNFQEGKYVINQQKSDEQLFKIKEEREYISELNERIFKLHKAIKEKQLEEQQFVRQSKTNDLNIMRHLDNLEQLTMSIFTNNTNIREIEMMGSELIDKIRGFKPQSTRELSIQITSKRLQQLSLEKIQSLKTYNELMGYKEEEQYELFSQVDDHQMNNLTHQIYDEEYIDKHPPPRSYSQSPDAKQRIQDQIFKSPQPKTDHINLISADQFMYLDEEQKKQKAELEVWRNLHNEILKNYLMTKGPLVQNKHIQEISSDVSSKNDQISDNSSQFSSNTGGASSVGSLFNQNFQQTKSLAPGLNYKGLSPNNNQNQDNQDMELLNEAEEALKFKENEDLKRHFYTLAIHNSKKILKSVPQGQILKNLYNKSKELRVEVADWENFIQREFKYLRSSVQLV
ncbi:UNKNOWN [Stylonychia lemnae]|uniref:Uncharacterized protein n=1 Tax=Stylonychia lemnae TaxID=5949 RepID=A0A078ASP9_STYLE|nr:UNKNOWN [Stylonychia lemnae]|eukprot:CDW85204.1 UNKNOWN [Stylonychia lemnae]